jgi:hypothetical protein
LVTAYSKPLRNLWRNTLVANVHRSSPLSDQPDESHRTAGGHNIGPVFTMRTALT